MPSVRAATRGLPATGSAATTTRAYIELMKPRIIVLLLITTVPAMVIAQRGWPDTWLVVATLIGGALSAGGAGALNHVADRDIDLLMQRTRDRPLPAGIVEPRQATVFGVALATAAALWLAWQVNVLAAGLSVLAVLFYIGVYTYGLKRTTVQNVVVGGAAGAVPPLIGWAAVTGSIGIEALLLFLLVFYWTPPHFWALSLRLADDYRAAGVPMMPVVRGVRETTRQILLYSVLLVALSFITGAVAELRWLYFAVAAGGGGGFLWLAYRLRRSGDDDDAIRLYLYSIGYLAALFGAMMADQLLLG